MMNDFDLTIVGAGIAGASLGWRLAGGSRLLLLEREAQPGMHATGRSAAIFIASYGPPQERALARASRAFYAEPPAGLAEVPLMQPRGVLYLASPGQEERLAQAEAALQADGIRLERLSAAEVCARVPMLRPECVAAGLLEPDAADLDVHALHQGLLRGLRRQGGELRSRTELLAARREGDGWTLELSDGQRLRSRHLVNAAGAWADECAQRCGVRPLGLRPLRRSAFTFAAPPGLDPSGWPAVIAIDESWYFKPDAGRLLGSPANADPNPPQDVQPEELDIALGIDRIQQVAAVDIRRPLSTWAGLRTFTPDGELAIGWDDEAEGFFWLAGQGGYGIQSAAGASMLAAALIRGDALPAALRAEGVDPEPMRPRRFQPPPARTC